MKKTLLAVCFLAAGMTAMAQEKVYYSEDFEWLADPWGAYVDKDGNEIGNTVGDDNLAAYCPFIDTPKYTVNGIENVTPKAALESKGMSFLYAENGKTDDAAGKSCYLQKYYLKFGKKNFQGGIAITGIEGVPADAELNFSFDWCPMRQGADEKTGIAPMDPTKLVVIVTNGEDSKTFEIPEHGMESNSTLKWIPAKVNLAGCKVDKDTKITIRPEDAQWSVSGQHRWFLDNLKLYSGDPAGVAAIEAADEAAVEYYNLQGVRVANPENGIFIVKQGSKVTKKVIR